MATAPHIARNTPIARNTHWLDHWMSVTVIIAGCVAMANNFPEPDLWGHVQYGRDTVEHGLSETATYTFTAVGYPWINHEILSEIALSLGVDSLGITTLLVAKCLFSALLLTTLMVTSLRAGNSRTVSHLIVLLVATNLTFFWNLRPQLFSFGLFTLELLLLKYCFDGWAEQWWLPYPQRLAATGEPQYCSYRLRHLWLAPVLFFIWANTHGAFAAGLAIYCVYLTLRATEAVIRRGWAAWGLVKRFALMILAAIAGSMMNPYGLGLHGWLIESLSDPRPEIIEWLPPELNDNFSSLAWVPFWVLLAVSLLAIGVEYFSTARRRPGTSKMDATQLAIIAIVIFQSLEHRRHIALAALLIGFWLPSLFGRLSAWFSRDRGGLRPTDDVTPYWLRIGLATTLAMVMGRGMIFLGDQVRSLPVRRDLYPVSALQYMADHQFNGKAVVAFDWAQYVIMAMGNTTSERNSAGERSGLLVQFDGRYDTCYPRAVVDLHFDFELGNPGPFGRCRAANSPAADGSTILSLGAPNLALIHRGKPHAVKLLEQSQDRWVLLYQDQIAQLWGRSDWYDNPRNRHYVPPHDRCLGECEQVGAVAWPALPALNSRLASTRKPTGEG